ncbi:hypothetical protein GKZ89_13625 [Bacillus mangrovi]|uniref:Uncharacterized protein n=1 Tax=Metabacillus mangrovi TaxID=1491830 RepID=A0A7X2S690_9BACI|nr:hypothetical protein [Metabacillus mangrovi]MTH54438.1 hypothetical protein [Metabacillus mangrovi]
MEILVREIAAALPEPERALYRFITEAEDNLARQSDTREQFMNLLTVHSPHHQAAKRFQLTLEETVAAMQKIEDKIGTKLEERLKGYKWMDYTGQQDQPEKLCFLCFI